MQKKNMAEMHYMKREIQNKEIWFMKKKKSLVRKP